MNQYIQKSVSLGLKHQRLLRNIGVKKCGKDGGIGGGNLPSHILLFTQPRTDKFSSLVECDTVSLSEEFRQYDELQGLLL
jgi:hypothetical protein